MRNRLSLLAAIVALPLASLSAQAPVAKRNSITIQPLSALVGAYSLEFERAFGSSMTWGFGGTFWNFGDGNNELTYNSGDLKVRWYPGDTPLNGFSLGASFGFSSITGKSSAGIDETGSGTSLGALLEYQWLLGSSDSFALVMGGGFKTLMVDDTKFSSGDFLASYPTGRFSIGYAF